MNGLVPTSTHSGLLLVYFAQRYASKKVRDSLSGEPTTDAKTEAAILSNLHLLENRLGQLKSQGFGDLATKEMHYQQEAFDVVFEALNRIFLIEVIKDEGVFKSDDPIAQEFLTQFSKVKDLVLELADSVFRSVGTIVKIDLQSIMDNCVKWMFDTGSIKQEYKDKSLDKWIELIQKSGWGNLDSWMHGLQDFVDAITEPPSQT